MSSTPCENLDETKVPAKKLKQARLVFKPLASPSAKKENTKNVLKRKFNEVEEDVIVVDENDSNKEDSKENKSVPVCQENGTAEPKETVSKKKKLSVSDDEISIIKEVPSEASRSTVIKTPPKDENSASRETRSQKQICPENGISRKSKNNHSTKKESASDQGEKCEGEDPSEKRKRCGGELINSAKKADVNEANESEEDVVMVEEAFSELVKEANDISSRYSKSHHSSEKEPLTDEDRKFEKENLSKGCRGESSEDSKKEGTSTADATDEDVIMIEEDSSENVKKPVSSESKTEINEDEKSKESLASSENSEKDLNVSISSTKEPVLASSISTPVSERKNPKPRKLTPKQIEKQQEREKMRLEKEKKKAEELEAKLKMKRDKEEAKRKEQEEREKLKKEKEDAKKKESEEKKKLEELKKKEREEKEKKRLAEIEQKNEERIRREEEKRKADEEKKKQEELKQQEENKVKAAFASFFVKKQKTEQTIKTEKSDIVSMPTTTAFMPFQEKPFMKLAPVNRVTLAPEQLATFENVVLSSPKSQAEKLYLDQLKSADYHKKTSGKTWPFNAEEEIDIIESDDQMEIETNMDSNVRTMRAKLLQFHENRRPPYYGTWRKKSKVIKPYNPFQKDTVYFDYEVDSDDEWEEGEGESLRGSDDEKESEDDYEVDNETFVPHGYLSDEEAAEEEDHEDSNPEAQKLKLKLLGEEFEADMNTKTERLKPVLVGPMWINNNVEETTCADSRIVKYLMPRRAVWKDVNSSISTSGPPMVDDSSPTEDASAAHSSSAPKNRQFTDEEIKNLIIFIHGSVRNRQFLSKEFSRHLESQSTPASLRSVTRKIREIATYTVCPNNEGPVLTGKKCWFVSPELRAQYGLSDLVASNNPHAVSSADPLPVSSLTSSPSVPCITKFTKVLSEEDRLKQLAEPVSDHQKSPARSQPVPANHGPTSLITKYTKILSEEECLKQLTSPVADKTAKPCDKPSKSPSIVNFLKTQKTDLSPISSPVSSTSNLYSAPKEKKRLPLLASVKVGEEIPETVRPSCALTSAKPLDNAINSNPSKPQPMETDISIVKVNPSIILDKEKKRLPLLASVKVGEEIPKAVRPSCALNSAKSADNLAKPVDNSAKPTDISEKPAGEECKTDVSKPQPMETDGPTLKKNPSSTPIGNSTVVAPLNCPAKAKKRVPLLVSVKRGEPIPSSVRPSATQNQSPNNDTAAASSKVAEKENISDTVVSELKSESQGKVEVVDLN